jgi:hypothetical protein
VTDGAPTLILFRVDRSRIGVDTDAACATVELKDQAIIAMLEVRQARTAANLRSARVRARTTKRQGPPYIRRKYAISIARRITGPAGNWSSPASVALHSKKMVSILARGGSGREVRWR